MAALSRGELLRKVVHMGVGGIAFAVRFLGPAWSAVCAVTAVLFNLLLLPRLGGRNLWRQGEAASGFALGIVLYPVTVLLLILAFWTRIEVAAAVWGILAFGDGMASVVGMTFGRAKLPWNPRKSWAGSLGYLLFGTAGATTLLLWTVPGRYSFAFALAVCAAATAFAALLESLPQGLDDNLGVPLVTGLLLFCLLLTQGHWQQLAGEGLGRRLLLGAAINLVLGLAGYAAGGVDRSGLVVGFLLGTAIYACLDWRGYVLLLAFFVLGTLATRTGYARKAAAKLAQEKGGRRGAKNALSKVTVPMFAAFFAATTEHPVLFALAFAGALATASSDTVSSELGQLWGRRTFLITTFRPVPRGTEGAVSLEGTLAGVAASLLVGGLGYGVGLFPAAGVAVVVIAAFVGTTLESLVGATIEKRGLLDNEAVNFLNTLCGALAAAALTPWLV